MGTEMHYNVRVIGATGGRGVSNLARVVIILVLAVAAVAAATAVQVAPASAASGDWCAVDPAPPCVISATRSGSPVISTDATWDIALSSYSSEGSNVISWNVERKSEGNLYDLGADQIGVPWAIVFNTGSVLPRVTGTRAFESTVARGTSSGDHTIEITGSPVQYAEGCTTAVWPWVCTETPTYGLNATLGGQFTDYGAWIDVAERISMLGLDTSTNIEAYSLPPEVRFIGDSDTPQLLLRLANTHFQLDNVTPFLGFVQMRIPATFLRVVYGIDDPTRFGTSGVDAVLTSTSSTSTGSIALSYDSGGMNVSATNLTFSARTIRLRVDRATPSRPGKLKAKRTAKSKAKLRFKAAKSRGSKVRRYVATCKGDGFKHTVSAKTSKRSVTVRKLKANRKYTCKVRATSKAGPGDWSKKRRVKPS